MTGGGPMTYHALVGARALPTQSLGGGVGRGAEPPSEL